MNRFKIFYLILGLVLVFSGCKKSNQFVIKGKIAHAENKMIYLDELLVSHTVPVDSAKINKKGEFEIKGKTSSPTFYLLKLGDSKFITLLVDSLEVVNIEADELNFSRDYSISGSQGSALVKELSDHLNITKLKLDSLASLSALFKGRPEYSIREIEVKDAFNKIVEDQVKYSTTFVQKNPFSMASVLALYQKFDAGNYVVKDLQSMKVAASALQSIYPESEHVRALYANTVKLMQDESREKVMQMIDEQGVNSPDIVLPGPSGNEVSLSSFRGKYVLLHFWSARDRDSRIVNEALAEAYARYKNKGFEIYQVSVDTDREIWTEAIAADGLKWTNVGDMKGSNQAVISYNIKAIPYNYLLDKEGLILAQNLKGTALNAALSKYIK